MSSHVSLTDIKYTITYILLVCFGLRVSQFTAALWLIIYGRNGSNKVITKVSSGSFIKYNWITNNHGCRANANSGWSLSKPSATGPWILWYEELQMAISLLPYPLTVRIPDDQIRYLTTYRVHVQLPVTTVLYFVLCFVKPEAFIQIARQLN